MLRYFGDGLSMPGCAALDANLSTTLPRFAWATNRLGTATSGSGLADDGLRRALGEYFERRHFYHEVRGDESGPLAAVRDDPLRQALIKAFGQTAAPAARERINSHCFALSTVVRLPTFEPAVVPTILFRSPGTGWRGTAISSSAATRRAARPISNCPGPLKAPCANSLSGSTSFAIG